MHRSLHVLFVLLALFVPSHLNAAPRIHFGQSEFKVAPNQPLEIPVFIDADDRTQQDDLFPAGLFIVGVQLDFDRTKMRPINAAPVIVPSELDFFGFEMGAYQEVNLESIGFTANIDQNVVPSEPYRGSHLATITMVNLAAAADSYELSLGLFRTLGSNEQIVLDGDGTVLDDDLVFGATRIVVVDVDVVEGDFDGDGELTVDDVDAICAQFGNADADGRFDLNDDRTIDFQDLLIWINEVKNTYIGDANLDGEFNTSDFVQVFIVGEYEDAIANNSTWAEGDWNCDGEFSTRDFVVAFQADGFERGPRPPFVAVPEPPTKPVLLIFTFCLTVVAIAQQKRRVRLAGFL